MDQRSSPMSMFRFINQLDHSNNNKNTPLVRASPPLG